MPDTPELCTVVMSYRNERTVLEAVASLRDQDVPLEIVVSHSGGGDTPDLMSRAGIPCVASEERRLPGAARNAGVAATTAPFVSFLEGDCLAAPGWAAGRLARHRAGAVAVGSALEPFDTGTCSRAAWLVEHSARLSLEAAPDAAQHGLSFARSTLARFGPFPEDMLVGEDSEVTSRLLASGTEIEWAPDVVTVHRYPTTVRGLLTESWVRGRRRATTRIAERGRRTLACDAIGAPSEAASRALRRRRTRVGHPAVHRPAPDVGQRRLEDRGNRALLASAEMRTRLIATLAVRDEMRFLPGFFDSVGPHVDGVVALDDGSTDGSAEYLAGRAEVLELIRNPSDRPEWDEVGNYRRLVRAAVRHGADWIASLDADHRVEIAFRDRAERLIEGGRPDGVEAWAWQVRELWETEDQWRADGMWGQKWRANLFRARADHAFDERRLHARKAPLQAAIRGTYPKGDVIVYHLRMVDRRDRAARRERYERMDPDAEFQSNDGYAYLTDEADLALLPVPRDRHWRRYST